MHTRVDGREVSLPARLQGDREAGVEQARDEAVDVRLQERLTARDADERRAVRQDRLDQRVDGPPLAPGEGIGLITPRAAQITTCEPNEHTRPTGEGALALDAVEDLGDAKAHAAADHIRDARRGQRRCRPARPRWLTRS
jgi:hypothetical protein